MPPQIVTVTNLVERIQVLTETNTVWVPRPSSHPTPKALCSSWGTRTCCAAGCGGDWWHKTPSAFHQRTIQRSLDRHGIQGAGSSRHNWFYPAASVETALAKDFQFSAQSNGRKRRAA